MPDSAVTSTTVSAEATRKNFRAAFEFTKDAGASSDGVITIKGYASTWLKDRDGEYVAPDAFDGSWEKFLSKNPMMLYQHNPDWPIGTYTKGVVDDHGLFVAGKVPPPKEGEIPEVVTAYNKIASGVLRTFSISGFMEKQIKAGQPVITNVDLFEISVVTIPANEDSLFAAAKRFALGENPGTLAPQARAQMEQLLGFKALTDPELEAMTADEIGEHWTALVDLFKSCYGVEPPPRDAWLRVIRAKNAGVSVPVVARAGAEVVRSFYKPDATPVGTVEGKAGRTISHANEAKLVKARDHIDEVLASVTETKPPDAEQEWQMGEPLDSAVNPPTAARMAARGLDMKTYRDLQSALEAAINDQYPDPDEDGDTCCRCWVEDFSDEWVVFYHDGELWKSDWSESDEGDIQIGEPHQVRTVTTYVDLSAKPREGTVELDHEGKAFLDFGAKGALPVRDLPIADRDAAWDGEAARKRIKAWAGGETPNSKYARAFLWRDGDGKTYTEYRFPVADVIDDTLTYVPKAIFAAAASVQGARGGTSDETATAIKPKLTTLYEKLATKFKDEIKPPWSGD